MQSAVQRLQRERLSHKSPPLTPIYSLSTKREEICGIRNVVMATTIVSPYEMQPSRCHGTMVLPVRPNKRAENNHSSDHIEYYVRLGGNARQPTLFIVLCPPTTATMVTANSSYLFFASCPVGVRKVPVWYEALGQKRKRKNYHMQQEITSCSLKPCCRSRVGQLSLRSENTLSMPIGPPFKRPCSPQCCCFTYFSGICRRLEHHRHPSMLS